MQTLADRRSLYRDAVVKTCKDLSIDVKIFSAIIEIESCWRPSAVRYESKLTTLSKIYYFAAINEITPETEAILEKCSWGLGQILGVTARNLGMKIPIQDLSQIECGLFWAGMYLKKLLDRYPDQDKVIASYNAGSPIYENGLLLNQGYVDKVNKVLRDQK